MKMRAPIVLAAMILLVLCYGLGRTGGLIALFRLPPAPSGDAPHKPSH